MKIDIVIDTICPWCFIGKRRLERALAARPVDGLQVGWRPFQLNPNLPRDGVERRRYLTEKFGGPDRAQARHRALEAAGAEEGIEFRFDLISHTPNTVDSHRLVRFAAAYDLQTEIVDATFRAFFLEGRNIGQIDELVDIAATTGLPRDDVSAFLYSDHDRDAVLAEDDLARGLGIGGVPCYIVDRKYAISGAQSPEVFFQVFELARQDRLEAAAG